MSIRGTHNNRKDGNQSEIVKALRKQGAHVYIFDDPSDLLVKYQGVLHVLDVKAIGGRPTEAQLKFNDKMRDVDGKDTIAFVRTIDEAFYAIGAKVPPYDYKVEIYDKTIILQLDINTAPRPGIIALLEGLSHIQGVKGATGPDDKDEIIIWPMRNIKIEALLRRIDHYLDMCRIGGKL